MIQQQHGMYFVSINKQLTDGQFTTAKSRKTLEEKAAASIIAENHDSPADIEQLLSGQPAQSNKYLSNDDHFHPKLKGYQIMTNRLYEQMAAHISWLKEE